MNAVERISRMLADVGDGIGCRHAIEPDPLLDMALLARLGLIHPINTRVPSCAEHGCPLVGTCRFQADFDDRRGRRAGRKFRLSAEGKAAASDTDLLRQLAQAELEGGPLAGLLDWGETTIFDLAARLMETEPPVYARRELGALLRLFQACGIVTFEPDGVTVRRVV